MAERERIGNATAKSIKTNSLVLNGVPVTAVSGAPIKIVAVALAAVDTGGGIVSWVNPEVGAIVVTGIVLDVTTVATAACSVSAGTTVVSATTSSANLIDTLDVHSATGAFSNFSNPGSGGKTLQRLAAGGWVTVSKASGASAGIVGNAYISYFVL